MDLTYTITILNVVNRVGVTSFVLLAKKNVRSMVHLVKINKTKVANRTSYQNRDRVQSDIFREEVKLLWNQASCFC